MKNRQHNAHLESVSEFLILLQKRMPPGDGQRHNLTVDSEGRLELTLMLGDKYQSAFITEEDASKPAKVVVGELIDVLVDAGYERYIKSDEIE